MKNYTKNIAVLIRGQLRTFCKKEVHTSFISLLDDLKRRGHHVVCFFAINKTSAFGSPWRFKQIIKKQPEIYKNKRDCKDTINKNAAKINENFDNVLKQLNTEYNCWEYGSDFIREGDAYGIPRSHVLQMKLTERASQLMLDHELENNIQFDYVIKTRPDLLYDIKRIRKMKLNPSDYIYYNHDYFRLYPRYAFNFYMDKFKNGDLINWILNELHRAEGEKDRILHLHDLILLKSVVLNNHPRLNNFEYFPVKTHREFSQP